MIAVVVHGVKPISIPLLGCRQQVLTLHSHHAEEPEDGEQTKEPPLNPVGRVLPIHHSGDGEGGRRHLDKWRLWFRLLLNHEPLEERRSPQRQELSAGDNLDLARGQRLTAPLAQGVRLGGLQPRNKVLIALWGRRNFLAGREPAPNHGHHCTTGAIWKKCCDDPRTGPARVLTFDDHYLAFSVERAAQGHPAADLVLIDGLARLVHIGERHHLSRGGPDDLDASPVPLPPAQPRAGRDHHDQDHHAHSPARSEQQFGHPVTVSRRREVRGYSGAVAPDQNPARPWRLALVQENATVGDLEGNAALVVARTHEAAAAGACLVAFPEMFLTGYPVEDLALRKSFIEASQRTLADLARRLEAEGLGHIDVIVGYLDSDVDHVDRLGRPRHSPQNAAALLRAGSVASKYAKHHLPNYGVFDEYRYFVPGSRACTIEVQGRRVALAICEDLWQEGGPVSWAQEADADLLLVINGSPYERDKDDTRLDLCNKRAREAGMPLAYVNLVGGQDELVFDGDSLVVDKDGEVLARAGQFTTELLCVDVFDDVAKPPPARMDSVEEVYRALVCGLGDYVRKNGFSSVVIGMSGGIDSALTAALAVDALGAQWVHGVGMPSVHSSQHSRDDAADMASRTGMPFRELPIAPMVDAYLAQLDLTGLAAENLQARVRGTTLMAVSNEEGHLVLATGNKSELAVGYSTLYGDAVGAYAPLKDVSKTMVWQLSRWRNDQAQAEGSIPPIPPNSITKPPSAELRPGQLDTDSLPDYALLDDVLDDYVEQDSGAAELIAAGFSPELVEQVLTMTDRAEYKRRQYPPGPKISFKAFGRDRRLPITSRWRENIDELDAP